MRSAGWRPTGWCSGLRTPPTDARRWWITDLGRSTVEDATVTLNEQVFADIGMAAGESQALVLSIDALRRNAGDF
jgi:hypothetical protein